MLLENFPMEMLCRLAVFSHCRTTTDSKGTNT